MNKQQIFNKMNYHLINDSKPSDYFEEFITEPYASEYPFNLLQKLKLTKQSPKHHPEGNVWNHTMLVVNEAAIQKAKSKYPDIFMWSALLHDIGKPASTRIHRGRITSYNHDKLGAVLTTNFLSEFVKDVQFVETVSLMVRWHMQILFVVKGLPFGDIENMKRQIDVYEIALLGLCDHLGRLGVNRKKEEESMNLFLQKCNSSLL